MQHCVYSPLPIESYFIKARSTDAVRTTAQLENGLQIWNLMWLSHPPLDTLPGAGANWYEGYMADPDLYGAIARDVNTYDALREKLDDHPAIFAAWFAKEYHQVFECYKVKGQAWVDTVLERAKKAADALADNIKVDGNVVTVKFGG